MLLCGCQPPTNLYVAATTVVGVNAAVNTEQTAGHLKIGYDRDFVTVVPRSVAVPGHDQQREVMAALSCSEVEVTGIFLTGFKEYLATGQAARNYAQLYKIPSKPDPASAAGGTTTPSAAPSPPAGAGDPVVKAATAVAADATPTLGPVRAKNDKIFACFDNAPDTAK